MVQDHTKFQRNLTIRAFYSKSAHSLVTSHKTGHKLNRECPAAIYVSLSVFLASWRLPGTTTIPKVTVVETSTVLWFTEDNPHGAAVVNFVTRFARG